MNANFRPAPRKQVGLISEEESRPHPFYWMNFEKILDVQCRGPAKTFSPRPAITMMPSIGYFETENQIGFQNSHSVPKNQTMKKSNILFLDFDGVLISSRSRLAIGNYPAFDPVSCSLVEKVCRYCHAQIVIYSAWREGRTKSEIEAILGSVGISPSLMHRDWATSNLGGRREIEIKEWLHSHPEIKRHVILDDGADPKTLFPHVVQPDADAGLMLEHVIDVCALFEMPFEPLFMSAGLKPAKEDHSRYQEKITS